VLSHLCVLAVSWVLFFGVIRVMALVDALPQHRKRLGPVLLLVALGVWLVATYYLIAPTPRISEDFRHIS